MPPWRFIGTGLFLLCLVGGCVAPQAPLEPAGAAATAPAGAAGQAPDPLRRLLGDHGLLLGLCLGWLPALGAILWRVNLRPGAAGRGKAPLPVPLRLQVILLELEEIAAHGQARAQGTPFGRRPPRCR